MGKEMDKAYLILADGTVWEGRPVGAEGTAVGETVFTTGMTGYLETLTDPSYYGQIVTQTFPLIGNYGVIGEDFESGRSWVRGYVVRELCEKPSNFRCGGDLDSFLKEQGIVGICGIDTRALTKRLREAGVMNGMIASGEAAARVQSGGTDGLLREIRAYSISGAVRAVQQGHGVTQPDGGPEGPLPGSMEAGTDLASGAAEAGGNPQAVPASGPARRVALLDFGAKANIRRELERRGCRVTVLPCDATADEVLALAPGGIMLSNGPGDPAENVGIIGEIRKLCGSGIPIFGICLGHQMLALARGARTVKLKYGHRGGNHPVKDPESGRVLITSQNHGYAVDAGSLPPHARLSFINANDGTCEGIEYGDIPAFSVQFHPEACAGPHDSNFLFDRFIRMIDSAAGTGQDEGPRSACGGEASRCR